MRTVARPTLAEEAYAQLLRAIVHGELAPGERLRDQELAAKLGISRTPVREALRRLADDGLVETSPQASTRVAPLEVETAAQAFPVVAALQALAARLGVPALTTAQLARMESAMHERKQALDDGRIPDAIDADDRFHDVLVDASGNVEIKRTLARLMPKLRRLDLMHFSALADRSTPDDEHEALFEACRSGAAERAAAISERSFLAVGAQIAAILTKETE